MPRSTSSSAPGAPLISATEGISWSTPSPALASALRAAARPASRAVAAAAAPRPSPLA